MISADYPNRQRGISLSVDMRAPASALFAVSRRVDEVERRHIAPFRPALRILERVRVLGGPAVGPKLLASARSARCLER